MGKPAARMGDTTVHGGVIVVGFPTVLIGGQPAARIGDMHTCPMQTPAGPVPIPHVGGPITLGSPTVLIGNMPAARMGDMCTCVGPPDSIAAGCPTVLIGESGSGSGGGGGGGASGQGKAKVAQGGAAAKSSQISGKGGSAETEGEESEGHSLKVKFVDAGGKLIVGPTYGIKGQGLDVSGVLAGKINQTGVKSGDYEIELKAITKADWSTRQARDGEKVKIQIEAMGIADGVEVAIEVWERDAKRPDQLLQKLDPVAISGGKVEVEWQYRWEDDPDDKDTPAKEPYYAPSFYFCAGADGCIARSPLLKYKDFIELTLKDDDDKGIADAPYRVFLSNGEVREGKLNGGGCAKIENVPPGRWRVEFPDHGVADEG